MPDVKTADHRIDTLDLGSYAHVGMMAVTPDGLPATGVRNITVTHIEGDHTATVHVEQLMWLNIEFNSSAVLSFHVTLYEVCVCVTDVNDLMSEIV